MHPSPEQIALAGRLLGDAGITGPFEMAPLLGGANSRAFRIDLSSGGVPLFLKEYFHHPDDPRDRQRTEFAFASFAWNHGLRTLARPLAMNQHGHGALYTFLAGRKLEPHEVTLDAIEHCLRFYEALNACKGSAQASPLPIASEACFSLADHWQCLERRVRRFESIVPASPLDQQASEFAHAELAPACSAYLRDVERMAGALGIRADVPIATADRCLSPSDFGFHNVLRRADGVLQFFDFEYAGWDDPAKTVCDYFCQPACPVPLQHYAHFADRLAKPTMNPMLTRRRFDLLLPMYRLKWCCIMLNDFLPTGGSRRRFAIQGVDDIARKTQQLQKARMTLDRHRNAPTIGLAA